MDTVERIRRTSEAALRIRGQLSRTKRKRSAEKWLLHGLSLILAFWLGTLFSQRPPQAMPIAQTPAPVVPIAVVAARELPLPAPADSIVPEFAIVAPITRAKVAIRATAPLRFGHLRVLAQPWAEIRLDDVEVGETPKADVSVLAGSHVIELSNSDLRLRERFPVTVAADSTTLVDYNFFDHEVELRARKPYDAQDW